MSEDRHQEIKDTIRAMLDDDTVRVKELTYRDLSHDHSTVEIIVTLEKDEND
jgi:hypothetical protein